MELELAQSLLSSFGLKESIVSFKRVASGLINSTFVLNSKTNSYILQSINTHVFPNYEKGLENIINVGNWLKKKNYSYLFPLPVKEEYLKVKNAVWRLLPYVKNWAKWDMWVCCTYHDNSPENPRHGMKSISHIEFIHILTYEPI